MFVLVRRAQSEDVSFLLFKGYQNWIKFIMFFYKIWVKQCTFEFTIATINFTETWPQESDGRIEFYFQWNKERVF